MLKVIYGTKEANKELF